MRETSLSLEGLSDQALIARLEKCLSSERAATALLLACLAEVDRRRLYLSLGYSSLFTYCTQALHLSERAAYGRIEAARLARRFPIALAMIASGRVSLTTLALLGKHLTEANHGALLAEATHKSIREVELMVARMSPQRHISSTVRRVPAVKPVVIVSPSGPEMPLLATTPIGSSREPSEHADSRLCEPLPEAAGLSAGTMSAARGEASASAEALATPGARAVAAEVSRQIAGEVLPVGPARRRPPGLPLDERYSLHVTISKRAHGELMRARDLLRHVIPSGDIALVLERALAVLMADLERKKLAMVEHPKPSARPPRIDTRHIPTAVSRQVWRRDRGRCAFVGAHGRCRERGFLEVHHVIPFAAGGKATVENLELRCRAHNRHEADVYFGGQRAP